MSENSQVMVFVGLLKQAADTLHGTINEVPGNVMHAVPSGNAITIAANAAHAITGIDGIVLAMIKGAAPVMMSEPTGLSAPPPMGGPWGDWGQTVQIDQPVFQAYAKKVLDQAADYLGTLTDADLEREVGFPSGGNEMSVARWLGITVLNVAWHTGEIASLKGTHGLKGYPF